MTPRYGLSKMLSPEDVKQIALRVREGPDEAYRRSMTPRINGYYWNHDYDPRVKLEDLKVLLQVWPNHNLAKSIERFGDVYPLGYYRPPIRAYLAGYAIHQLSPVSFEATHGDRATCLSRARERNQANGVKSDQTSSRGHPLIDYSPFDLVEYQDLTSQTTTWITRDDFSDLDRSQVPEAAIEIIEERLQLAKIWELPECQPLTTLLGDQLQLPTTDVKRLEYGSVRILRPDRPS